MISILLYGLNIVLLFLITACIVKKLFFRWQKICLIGVSCLLLVSAAYHTVFYGKPVFKIMLDPEKFYYPRTITKTYSVFEKRSDCILLLTKAILMGKRNNYIYPLIYWSIKDIYGEKYFLEGFFFVCILNCILFLFSLYLLFRIFSCFKCSKHFLWLCLFIFLQPFMIARNALPGANSMTIFTLILFFYTIIFSKRFYFKTICCFLMFLAHKTLWLPSIVGFFYLLLKEKIFTKKKLIASLIVLMWITAGNVSQLQRHVMITEHCSFGDSYIPASPIVYRLGNCFFAPLWTNAKLFFYKTNEGSMLGFLYAIYINFIVLFMFIKICFSFKKLFNLTARMKQVADLSMLFIFMFFLEGAASTNYLNLCRHATNSLIVWILLMLILESDKSIGRNRDISQK